MNPPSTPAPDPNGWRSSVYAVLQPGGVPRWKADWSVSDADGLAEWLALAELTDLTAEVGSWEAARTLFAPSAPCAGLYATQSAETPSIAPRYLGTGSGQMRAAQAVVASGCTNHSACAAESTPTESAENPASPAQKQSEGRSNVGE